MFARKNDDGNFDIFNDDGTDVTRFESDQPVVWVEGSTVSAHYEHSGGITLCAAEYAKIASIVPLDD